MFYTAAGGGIERCVLTHIHYARKTKARRACVSSSNRNTSGTSWAQRLEVFHFSVTADAGIDLILGTLH